MLEGLFTKRTLSYNGVQESYREITKMYKVDTDVKYPRMRTKYPFEDMHEGDSILFDERPEADKARVAALRFVRAHELDWKFSLRRVDDGWRLWRIK